MIGSCRCPWWVMAALCLVTSTCFASVEFQIDSGMRGRGGPAVFSQQAAAQEIFLPKLFIDGATTPSELLITKISPVFYRVFDGPNPIVTLQISRAIGLGTGSDEVLGSYSIEVDGFGPVRKVVETNLRLNPGRYFVVASSEVENWAIWPQGEIIIGQKYLASQFDADFPPDGRWHEWDAYPPSGY
jgi:hypothetical protein